MRRVGHRPASQTRCRFAADAAVAPPAATRNRTIATCCDAVVRQTQAQPPRSPLRPPKTKCPNTHSDRRTATASTSRGFLPCRLPDAGPGASGIVRDGRHPEPSTNRRRRPAPRALSASANSRHNWGENPWRRRGRAFLLAHISRPKHQRKTASPTRERNTLPAKRRRKNDPLRSRVPRLCRCFR